MMINSKYLKLFARMFFGRLGLHIIKSRFSRWQLELYSEQERPTTPRYINLGAGSFYHPFWHNIDMPNQYYSYQQNKLHISHDFTSMQDLLLKSDSVEIFYSSHVREHLSDLHVDHLFKEIHRALKINGVFRVTCPDIELQYFAYKNSDYNFWLNLRPWGGKEKSLEHLLVENFATCLCNAERFSNLFVTSDDIKRDFYSLSMSEFFNAMVSKIPNRINSDYPEGHINWFTDEKLILMLQKAGFTKVKKSAYLQSSKAIMREPRLFDGTCPELSLYIEATK